MGYLSLIVLLLPALAASLGVEKTASIRAKLGDEDPEPKWYPLFNVEFNETQTILFKRETAGKWWYDAASGNEVWTREDGRGDRYCGSIHPREATPCTHLVTEGKRFLIFPEKNECCLCCLDSQGCGITALDWLSDFQYKGTEEKNGVQAYTFTKQDLTTKYYYTTADNKQLPVQYEEWPTLYQSMHTSSFNQGPIDAALLKVPDNCTPRCPLTSLCTVAAHRKML